MLRLLFIIFALNAITVSAETFVTRTPYQYNSNRDFYHSYPHHQASPYNYNNNYNQPVHFPGINDLENYTFNRTFANDPQLRRLQRLENQTFGAIQNGDLDTRYNNVRQAILSRPNDYNRKSNLVRNFANYFAGQMTGFTPSLSNDPFFSSNSAFSTLQSPSNYGKASAYNYSTPYGSGYRFNQFGTGSSSGVKILD